MCTRRCPICKSEFTEGTKFCAKCGCNLQKEFLINPICPTCGKAFPDGTRFCDNDGSRLTTKNMLIPKCSICGKVYDNGTQYCPDDGGKIQTQYEKLNGASRETSAGSYMKAPNGSRFVAYLLDGLITGVMCIPSVLLWAIGIASSNDYYDSSSTTCIVFAVLLYVLPLTYFFIKDGFKGQSLGKRAVGIAVVEVNSGKRCDIGRSALRGLITMLINVIPLIGSFIEPIMVLATTDGRRLADKGANTQVIKL